MPQSPPPPRTNPSARPPMHLNYCSTAIDPRIDREIKRRWRRFYLRRAIGVAGTILTALLIITALMLWRLKLWFFLAR